MAQTTVEDLRKGLPGQKADSGFDDVSSYTNSSKQINRVSVDVLANAETFTVDINGTAFDFLSDADATAAEIVIGLVTAINLGAEPVTAINEGDTLRLVADEADVAFIVLVSATGVGVLSQAAIVANANSIDFGVLLVQDPNQDQGATPPILQADILNNIRNILGMSVHSHANEQSLQGVPNPGYSIKKTMSIMRRGRIYVTVEEAVTPADVPHVRFAPGAGGLILGAIRASTDTATAEPLPAEFRFKGSAGAGEVVVLEVSLP